MSNYLNKIVYLTDEQYETLTNIGSITINGTTHQYDQNTLYITKTDLTTSSPSTSGNATAFITSISQDHTGKITASKANLDTSGTWSGNATTATTADGANALINQSISTTNLDKTAGSFAFSIAATTAMTQITSSSTDYVGIQLGDNVDKWQLTATGNNLFFRQNDNGGTNATWNNWTKLLSSLNYKSYAWAVPSSITDNQVILSSGTDGSTALRAILNNTSTGALGWNSGGATHTDNLRLIDVNTLRYWDGAYSGNNSNITKVGTISNGTWNGTAIDIGYGGTGISTTNPHKILIGAVSGAVTATDAPTWRVLDNADLPGGGKITIGGTDVALGGSLSLETLGLASALRFIGITTTDMAVSNSEHDDTVHTYTGTPQGITGYSTPAVGDVVINSDNKDEWVCISVNGTTYTWERLGSDSSYKIVQDSVSDPTAASTTSTTFIDTISQNANGVITATKKTLPTLTNVAISKNITTNANYPVVFATSNTSTTAAKNEGLQKSGAKFYFNPSTGNLTSTKFNGLTLTNETTGFTIKGGSTNERTLTIENTLSLGAATAGGVIYGASNAYSSTAAGTSGQYLKSNGSSAPTWDTFSNSTVGLDNVTNDTQVKASLGTNAGDMLYWSAASTPARLAIGTEGYFLKATSTGPVWSNTTDVAISLTNTTASTTTATGALTVSGGVGIGGRITASEINATRTMVVSAGKVYSNISGSNVQLPAKTSMLFANGIVFAHPALSPSNDVGWLRILSSSESDTVFEIATGDDGGTATGEKIVVRQYNTSNAIAKEAVLLDKQTGTTSFPVSVTSPSFIGALTGNADTATALETSITLWGQTFDGTINITGNMTDVGPSMTLPENEDTFSFYTSTNAAAYGAFGRLSLYESGSSDLSTYNLDVKGKIRFDIGTSDSSSQKNLIISGNSRYLSIGAQGITAYTSANAVSDFYIQNQGGSLYIGNGTALTTLTIKATTANITWTTANMNGAYDFKTANGFKYSAISATSTSSYNISRPVWFAGASSTSATIPGTPVYNTNFKFNPVSNLLTIGNGSLDGGVLKLKAAASDPSTSAGARIEFAYTESNGRTQPVYISYTPNNTYREPAGLKIMGNGSTTGNNISSPAWFEVEGQVYAAGFNGTLTGDVTGNVTGNADTATTWETARTLTIGNKGQDIDGSADVSWTLRDIQADPYYNVGSTSSCTYVLVTLNKETSWMYAFTLRLYQNYKATDIQISGHNYGSNHWYSPQAVILGSTTTSKIKVYFGYTGNYKLWVAVDGSSYTGAAVFGLTNGYTQTDLENAVTITKVSALPETLQTTKEIYRPWYRDETVTNATNDSDGNAINSTYFKLTETRAATTSNTFSITNNTASTSTSVGALKVTGGIATGAASYLTGSVHIIGTAGNNPLIVRGIQGCEGATGNVGSTAASKELYLNYNNGGKVQIGFTETTADATNMLKVAYISDSSSISTGALVVDGGVGIAKKLYVGYHALIGGIKIGTGTSDGPNRTISVTEKNLIINAPSTYGVVFQQNGTNKVRIVGDTFYPESTDTGSLGTSTYKWNAMYATTFYGALSGNATSATKVGTGSIWLYPESNNKLNFGGTNNSTTIYLGYETKDSRGIPTKFIFGSSTGTADIQAAKLIGGSGNFTLQWNSTDSSIDFIFA